MIKFIYILCFLYKMNIVYLIFQIIKIFNFHLKVARTYCTFQSSKFLWIAPNKLALIIGMFLDKV